MKTDVFNNYKTFKVIQLLLLIIFFVAFFLYLKLDPVLSNNIFTNTKLLTICVFLWAYMIFSFVSVILDLRQLEKTISDTHDLNKIAYLDNLTGIPNRQSCDLMFARYEDSNLIKDVAVALISISNLKLINEELGREKGNLLILDFAHIFEQVGDKYGFVGRNGGNEFLITIEHGTEEKMNQFIDELSGTLRSYNETSKHIPVSFTSSAVYNSNEKKEVFGELVAMLYNQRG